MTPNQRRLARHALGLPTRDNKTYRNRYYTDRDHPEWVAMVKQGYALRDTVIEAGKRSFFYLTRKGAELALEPGERLDPEDFPNG